MTWQMKVWADLGESDWSEPAFWETSIVDWTARWTEPAEEELAEAGRRPAHLLRREFALEDVPARARVYATAHGTYELFVNGVRVGDHELTPGFTAYRSRLHVQTFDVTRLLRHGENAFGAVLSDGWFRGGCHHGGRHGRELAVAPRRDHRGGPDGWAGVGPHPDDHRMM